jgi:glyoxylate carboligase
MKALADEKVEFIWGYPGGSVLYIYDELYKQDKIQHVLVRHEQAAVHAADAYARSTGKVGVCRHVRPRRHQCGDRHRHRLHGFDPDGVITGQVPTPRSARTRSRSATRSASRVRA